MNTPQTSEQKKKYTNFLKSFRGTDLEKLALDIIPTLHLVDTDALIFEFQLISRAYYDAREDGKKLDLEKFIKNENKNEALRSFYRDVGNDYAAMLDESKNYVKELLFIIHQYLVVRLVFDKMEGKDFYSMYNQMMFQLGSYIKTGRFERSRMGISNKKEV